MLQSTTVSYLFWFLTASALCAALFYRNRTVQSSQTASADFKRFQRLFLFVYLLMMMADWLQGPYVYALYNHYGFTKGQIGQLFIVGFGSSLVFGTFVGGFADRYGRKANCLLFAVLYGLSCLTKHSSQFGVLMLGRVLGGVATSILMSAFETWMIHEHKAGGYPEEWLSSTFSKMTFGNGLIAIVAGLIASLLASNFGLVAPFDASLVLLLLGGAAIWTQWRENYGESSAAITTTGTSSIGAAFSNFAKVWRLLATNEKVLLLGLIQSCFESAMYIFVFMWTPALEASLARDLGKSAKDASPLPHGLVFAIFMVSIMVGSKIFEMVIEKRPVEQLSRWVFLVASIAMAVPVLTANHTLQLAAFCAFEMCCGLYFPAVGTMRGRYIPEEVRSTVMNVFRIGLNVIVVVTLVNIDTLSQDSVFLFTVLLLTIAVICSHRLFALKEAHLPQQGAKPGLAVGEEMDHAIMRTLAE